MVSYRGILCPYFSLFAYLSPYKTYTKLYNTESALNKCNILSSGICKVSWKIYAVRGGWAGFMVVICNTHYNTFYICIHTIHTFAIQIYIPILCIQICNTYNSDTFTYVLHIPEGGGVQWPNFSHYMYIYIYLYIYYRYLAQNFVLFANYYDRSANFHTMK